MLAFRPGLWEDGFGESYLVQLGGRLRFMGVRVLDDYPPVVENSDIAVARGAGKIFWCREDGTFRILAFLHQN